MYGSRCTSISRTQVGCLLTPDAWQNGGHRACGSPMPSNESHRPNESHHREERMFCRRGSVTKKKRRQRRCRTALYSSASSVAGRLFLNRAQTHLSPLVTSTLQRVIECTACVRIAARVCFTARLQFGTKGLQKRKLLCRIAVVPNKWGTEQLFYKAATAGFIIARSSLRMVFCGVAL